MAKAQFFLSLGKSALCSALPKSHVPVVVCRSAGSGQEAGQPLLENRQPEANRRTRLSGDRDKSNDGPGFLVSVGPPKAGAPKRLVFLAGRADGVFFQTMATLTATTSVEARRGTSNRPARFWEYVSITAHHPIVSVGPAGLPSTVQAAGQPPLPRFHRAGRGQVAATKLIRYGAGDRAPS